MNDDVLRRAHRKLMLSSIKRYTAELFEQQYKQKFIFGEHHLKICDALDKVVRGECKKLIINISPRYGKTELAVKMFISYGLAINPRAKFIHLSYSSSLAVDNSICVKDIVCNEYYQYVFNTHIAVGSNTKARWNTSAGGGLYATSTLGQITGFGAGITDREEEDAMDEFTAEFNPNQFNGAIVIDDPIKPEDALSDNMRESVNRRFETTIRNRVNSRNTPIIIIMQRLHEHDLCGYLQEIEPDDWTVLSMPCLTIDADGKEHALWPHKHTVEELHKIEMANSFVFDTQYQQKPTPLEGLMYREFKTYDALPSGGIRKNYTDSADVGSDFLCSIDYIEYKGLCYVIDILYTQKPMEYTEPALARMLQKDDISEALIESNNGGRSFMRNVESISREIGNRTTRFTGFTQTLNKQVRIFTHSNEVCNCVIFPEGWERTWPQAAMALKSFRKEGNNTHDDIPDVVTGMVEHIKAGRQNLDGVFY